MDLLVDGAPLKHTAAWGDLSWSTRWPGGDFEIRWSMDPGLRKRLPDAALVQVVDGMPVCSGELLEAPDGANGEDGEYVARGFSQVAQDYLALNASDELTSGVRAAINAAIDRGWAITRGASVPGPEVNLTDSGLTDGLNTVAALLDAAAEETDLRWGVGPDRVVEFLADPTEPSYVLRPGMVDLSPASDDFARKVAVRYVHTSGSLKAVFAGAGSPERPVDVTSRGPMTDARAAEIAAKVLSRVSRPGWTAALEVSSADLTTIGGQPANLGRVRAGEMVRLQGLTADAAALNGATYLDVVLGEVTYEAGAQVLSMTPVNAAISTFIAALEQGFKRGAA